MTMQDAKNIPRIVLLP